MPAPNRGLRRALFAFLCFAYAYFYQAGGANQNSRFDLVLALVENGHVFIDPYHTNTSDKACHGPKGRCAGVRGDHMYTDKAPGLSWLAVPGYAVIAALTPDARKGAAYLTWASYACVLLAVSLPSALAAVLLYTWLTWLDLAAREALVITLGYALATPAFAYSTLFYGHQTCAALLLAAGLALYGLRTGRLSVRASGVLSGVGALLGLAIALEYQALLAVSVLGLYALGAARPLWRAGWLLLGAAVVGSMLALYHVQAFGGPFTLGYMFSTKPDRGQGFFMGLGAPSPIALLQLTLLPWRGLFFSAPWLLVCIPGTRRMLRSQQLRAEGLLCAAIPLLFLWLNASLVDWAGGYTFGARYLIPALPFMAVAAGVYYAAARRTGRAICLALLAYSGMLMLIATAVRPEVPFKYLSPFCDLLIPSFMAGELAINTQPIFGGVDVPGGPRAAWNLGQLLRLPGLASLLPLVLTGVVFGLWIWRIAGQVAAKPTTSKGSVC